MKNINMIKVFMKENEIDFDKEFYVDFGEEQEVFNIDNLKNILFHKMMTIFILRMIRAKIFPMKKWGK